MKSQSIGGAPYISTAEPASNPAMRIPAKDLAYALLRVAFGVNFACHGFIRIYDGIGAFAQTTVGHLSKSPIPHSLALGFSYAIPVLEALLGVALILGLFTRQALVLGAIYMMALTIGVSSNQEWDVAGQQLLYSVVFFLLLFFIEQNAVAVDDLLRKRPRSGFAPPSLP